MSNFQFIVLILLNSLMQVIYSQHCCVSSTHINNLWLRGGAQPQKEDEKPFYALGINIARQVGGELKNLLNNDELDVMISGFKDSLMGEVSNMQEKQILGTHGAALNKIITTRATENLETRKKEGEMEISKFLKSNKDAKKTASGLVFKEEMTGSGPSPTEESIVEVHYHGTLMDGTVFDSSRLRGETVKFPVSKVIKGWQEGVQLMQEGSKAVLYIPSDLAYGDTGSPPVIPPGSTLKFEIELVAVLPGEAA